jgi:hypothetical protein
VTTPGASVTDPIQVCAPPLPAKSKAVARPLPEGPLLTCSIAAPRTTRTLSRLHWLFAASAPIATGSVLGDPDQHNPGKGILKHARRS